MKSFGSFRARRWHYAVLALLVFPAALARAEESGATTLQTIDPPGKRIRGLVIDPEVEIEVDGENFKLVVKGSLKRMGGVALGGEEVLAKSDSDETPTPFEWKTSVPRAKPTVEILVVDSTGKNLIGRFGLKGELPKVDEPPKEEPKVEEKPVEAVEIVPLGEVDAIRWKKGRVMLVEEEGKRYATFRGKMRGAGSLLPEGVETPVVAEDAKRDFEWKVEISDLPVELVLLRKISTEPDPVRLRYCVVAEGKFAAGVSCEQAKVTPGQYPVWRLSALFGGDSYEDSAVAATSQMALRLRGARWFGVACGGACRVRIDAQATAISFGGTPGPVRFAAVRAVGEYHWGKGLWSGIFGVGEVLVTSFSADYGFSPLYFPEVSAEARRAVGSAGAQMGLAVRYGLAPGGSQIAAGLTYAWLTQGGASWGVGAGFESLSKDNETGMIKLSSWGLTLSRTWF